ncbi:uncharacterized protein LOC125941086 [Dermacentor silvarum]|uniref:uncharacterized protein LOC125941086 n=1 Tax=Dermacentor silvarum TaxID=543639 RepID=UPI00210189FA|nr:uncharacterized protein LOC125941086 [Dermacentor silvarum]
MRHTPASALDLIVSPPSRLCRRRVVIDAITDASSTKSAPHYAAFVVLVASCMSASLLVTPAVLFRLLGSAGCGARCFSLEQDLLVSIDHSVHPCDDFYRLRAWLMNVPYFQPSGMCAAAGNPCASVATTSRCFKYRRYADRQVISTLLGRSIPRGSKSALDKAAVFLLNCLGQIQDLWDEYSPPAYQALNDSDLRLAINSELPDDSQLWSDDAVVNLHPHLYQAFERDQLMADDLSRKRLKLWLGAYAVWSVAPFASRFLYYTLLDDIGYVDLC